MYKLYVMYKSIPLHKNLTFRLLPTTYSLTTYD